MLTKIPCTNDSTLKNQLWYKIYLPQISELIFDLKTVLIIYLYMKKMKMKKKPNDLDYLLVKHYFIHTVFTNYLIFYQLLKTATLYCL